MKHYSKGKIGTNQKYIKLKDKHLIQQEEQEQLSKLYKNLGKDKK